MNQTARDVAIRTILGEAANQGVDGQAAVAYVLRNRAADPRWPSLIDEVALQPKQFSAWNSGAGGNDLVSKYGPGTPQYESAGQVYDAVMSGIIADPTGGATHYYSPAGMQALVSEGSQGNLVPGWWQNENATRGAPPTQIGGHMFTGKANLSYGIPPLPQATSARLTYGQAASAPESQPKGLLDAAQMALDSIQRDQPSMEPIQQQPRQAYAPQRRDIASPYLQLFESLRA